MHTDKIGAENFLGKVTFKIYEPAKPKVGVGMPLLLQQAQSYRSLLEDATNANYSELMESDVRERTRVMQFSKPMYVDDDAAPFRKELQLFDALAKKRDILMDPSTYMPDDAYGMCYTYNRKIMYNWNMHAPYVFCTLMHEYVHMLRFDESLNCLNKLHEELITQGVAWAALRALGLHMFDGFSFTYCSIFMQRLDFDRFFPLQELDTNFDLTYTHLMQDINSIPASDWQSERWEDFRGNLYPRP